MRVAVIILALVAMILGPVFGPAAAHGVPAQTQAADASGHDHRQHAGDMDASHHDGGDKDHEGGCVDANGCRHLLCFSCATLPSVDVGGPVPTAAIVGQATGNRPDGRDVAPLLDPPRSQTSVI